MTSTLSSIPITPALVRRFWRTLSERYGTRTLPKSQSWEMRAASVALDWLGILPRERFMGRYTTVWGRRIYPCFEVGAGDQSELWRQMVVCVHEHQHVVQYDRSGFGPYALRYALDRRARALLEAEAYQCNLEMHWMRFGDLPDLEALAARLADYGCRPSDQQAALDYYERAAQRIRRAAPLNEATQVALNVLDEISQDAELA